VSADAPSTGRIDGPAPVMGVARDLARRSLWLLPLLVVLAAMFWGVDGALSAAYALVVVVVNFAIAAWLLAWSGRRSTTLMGGVALAGFPARLGLVVVAVLAVRNLGWVELVPLALTLALAHLTLLFWELRYISGTPAFPGLRPPRRPSPNPYLPDAAGPGAASPPAPNLR
jgi:hypothetical protein